VSGPDSLLHASVLLLLSACVFLLFIHLYLLFICATRAMPMFFFIILKSILNKKPSCR